MPLQEIQLFRGIFFWRVNLSKRGIRSEKAQTHRKIVYTLKTRILQDAWHDNQIGETVCRTEHVTLRDLGYNIFGEHFSCSLIPDVDKGYVLSDCYGRGCFQ